MHGENNSGEVLIFKTKLFNSLILVRERKISFITFIIYQLK